MLYAYLDLATSDGSIQLEQFTRRSVNHRNSEAHSLDLQRQMEPECRAGILKGDATWALRINMHGSHRARRS